MNTIVALHSSQSHSGQWRFVAKALRSAGLAANSFITPDLQGYGRFREQPLRTPVANFRLADELTALQQQHPDAPWIPGGTQPVYLLGHSYGGATALRWARQYPAQVRGLVLYEPVSFHVLPHAAAAAKQGELALDAQACEQAYEQIMAIASQMHELSAAQATAAFVDYWNKPGYFARLPAAAQAQMISQQGKVLADFHGLIDEPSSLADYAQLQCDVALFYGEHSPLSSRMVAAALAATLPNCHSHSVAGGHMAPLIAPELVTPLMVQALTAMCQASEK